MDTEETAPARLNGQAMSHLLHRLVVLLLIEAIACAGSNVASQPTPSCAGITPQVWAVHRSSNTGAIHGPAVHSPLELSAARLTASVVIVFAKGDSVGRKVGTGFVVRRDGWIVTALHTVSEGDVEVGLPGPHGYQSLVARVVARDAANDIALLKINANTQPVSLSGNLVSSGADAASVGFPFGRTPDGLYVPYVTKGIVGAVRPPVQNGASPLLQMDIMVAPGSSGAPVFDPASGIVYGMIVRQVVTADNETRLPAGVAVPSGAIAALIRKGLATR